MSYYPLRYLSSGHIFIGADDDCHAVVDRMLEINYSEEFCVARDFTRDFISRLMAAGFLVMSTEIVDDIDDVNDVEDTDDAKDLSDEREAASKDARAEGKFRFFILLPKLHLVRSVLFFDDLHIKKSIRRFLPLYELRVNSDFDRILGKCISIHGEDWLTPPLVDALASLHKESLEIQAEPASVSFAVYRDGELKAGEIGVIVGKVYTSYSGYHEEDNAGTVQMILMAQWLQQAGFAFLDFGMPLDYKTDLGALDSSPERFVEIFRAAQKLDGTNVPLTSSS